MEDELFYYNEDDINILKSSDHCYLLHSKLTNKNYKNLTKEMCYNAKLTKTTKKIGGVKCAFFDFKINYTSGVVLNYTTCNLVKLNLLTDDPSDDLFELIEDTYMEFSSDPHPNIGDVSSVSLVLSTQNNYIVTYTRYPNKREYDYTFKEGDKEDDDYYNNYAKGNKEFMKYLFFSNFLIFIVLF